MLYINRFILITLLCVLLVTGIGVCENLPLHLVGHIGGESNAITVSGTTEYVGMGQSLISLNVANPSNPIKLGQAFLNGMVNGITISGNYAYVATNDYGLEIINIANPSALVRMGGYKTGGIAKNVAVAGNFAYLAADTNGLEIIDISTPSSPQKVSSYLTSGPAQDVAVQGYLAYVAADTNGLQVIDVGVTPPVWANEWNPRLGNAVRANAIEIVGNYAYLAASADGLEIIDISFPYMPLTRSSKFDTPGFARDIAMAGNYYAFVANDTNGISVINVQNPSRPELKGGCATNGTARAVAFDGSYLYVADGAMGATILSADNFSSPLQKSRYDTISGAKSVAIAGNYAYIADAAVGMRVVNVSDLTAPSLVATCTTTGQATGVIKKDNYAYLADGTAGLKIIDITVPSEPNVAGTPDRGCQDSYGVAAVGNYAYVADGSRGLQVVNMTTPSSPIWQGACDTSGISYAVAVSGSYAYVADGESGLEVVDISSVTSPQLKAVYDTNGTAYDVAISGNYALVADGLSGLDIIDLTNPLSPRWVGGCDTPGQAFGVTVVGNYAYVADGTSGLQVVDFSTPEAPVIAAGYDTAGTAHSVAVVGSEIYVADDKNGLVIYTSQTLTGSLSVTISPQEAIDGQAQWRRIGTANWHDSGSTESDIPIGAYIIEFKSITDLNTPAEQSVLIRSGQTASISASYVQKPKLYYSFGTPFGMQTLQDCNNVSVTFKITGLGYGEIAQDDCGFLHIALYNTTEKSQFTISTKGTTKTSVGDIIVNGSLKGITAKNVDLKGDITVLGSLETLTLANITNGRTITIGPSANPKAGVVMKFNRISDVTIDSDMPIKTFTATEWLGGSMTATSVGSVTTKGDKKQAILGNLDANLTVTGSIGSIKTAGTLSGNWTCVTAKSITAMNIIDANLAFTQPPDALAKVLALGKLTAKGWVDSSQICSTGNIGTVSAGAIRDSSCFAGIISATDLNTDGVFDLPDPNTHINYAQPATIKSFVIKGIKGQPYCFINSNASAANILGASLCYPENEGTPFGLSAGFIKALKIKTAAGTTSLKNLDTPANSQTFGDVQIRLY